MRRREFITLLGGAAAAWPLAARAQQPDRVRRIGILAHLPSDDADAQSRNAAFLQGLQELGWAVGRNVRIVRSLPRAATSLRPWRRVMRCPRCTLFATMPWPAA